MNTNELLRFRQTIYAEYGDTLRSSLSYCDTIEEMISYLQTAIITTSAANDEEAHIFTAEEWNEIANYICDTIPCPE